MVEDKTLPRGKYGCDSNTNKERKDYMIHWVDQIPKTESHYCRQQTEKVYFENLIPSYRFLYNLYAENSVQENIQTMSQEHLVYILKINFRCSSRKKKIVVIFV